MVEQTAPSHHNKTGSSRGLIIQKPELLSCGIEWAFCSLPKLLSREMRYVFPGNDRSLELFAIPTCQHSVIDLVSWGTDEDTEKDLLLEKFCRFARVVCSSIKESGYWADFIDPCSGLPMLCNDNSVNPYNEVDGMIRLLGYRSYSASMCKVLCHPIWGTAVYPATIFTSAPLEVVRPGEAPKKGGAPKTPSPSNDDDEGTTNNNSQEAAGQQQHEEQAASQARSRQPPASRQ